MQVILGLVIGFIVGVVVSRIHKTSGILLIDHTNPEKDIFRFDIDEKYLDRMSTKKRIVLKVDHNAQLSQK